MTKGSWMKSIKRSAPHKVSGSGCGHQTLRCFLSRARLKCIRTKQQRTSAPEASTEQHSTFQKRVTWAGCATEQVLRSLSGTSVKVSVLLHLLQLTVYRLWRNNKPCARQPLQPRTPNLSVSYRYPICLHFLPGLLTGLPWWRRRALTRKLGDGNYMSLWPLWQQSTVQKIYHKGWQTSDTNYLLASKDKCSTSWSISIINCSHVLCSQLLVCRCVSGQSDTWLCRWSPETIWKHEMFGYVGVQDESKIYPKLSTILIWRVTHQHLWLIRNIIYI